MEVKLGRLLSPEEVVHHKDENGHNNDPENLELMVSQEDHAKLHGKERPKHGPVTCDCAECGKQFLRAFNQRIESKGYINTFCSYSCNGKFQKRKQLALEAQMDEQCFPKAQVAGSSPA